MTDDEIRADLLKSNLKVEPKRKTFSKISPATCEICKSFPSKLVRSVNQIPTALCLSCHEELKKRNT